MTTRAIMILLSKLLPMGNNLLGKIIIARVVNFFRQIIARVTNIRNYCPLAITKNHKNRNSYTFLGKNFVFKCNILLKKLLNRYLILSRCAVVALYTIFNQYHLVSCFWGFRKHRQKSWKYWCDVISDQQINKIFIFDENLIFFNDILNWVVFFSPSKLL